MSSTLVSSRSRTVASKRASDFRRLGLVARRPGLRRSSSGTRRATASRPASLTDGTSRLRSMRLTVASAMPALSASSA